MPFNGAVKATFQSLARVFLLAVILSAGGAVRAAEGETLITFPVKATDGEGATYMCSGIAFGTNRVSFAPPGEAAVTVDTNRTTLYISPTDKSYVMRAKFYGQPVTGTNLLETFRSMAVASQTNAMYFSGETATGLGVGYRYEFTHPYPPPTPAMNESVVFIPIPEGYIEISLRATAPRQQQLFYSWTGVLGSLKFEPESKVFAPR